MISCLFLRVWETYMFITRWGMIWCMIGWWNRWRFLCWFQPCFLPTMTMLTKATLWTLVTASTVLTRCTVSSFIRVAGMFPTPLCIILFMFLSVNRSNIRIRKLPRMANIITLTPQKFVALCEIVGLCGIGVLNGSTKIANKMRHLTILNRCSGYL